MEESAEERIRRLEQEAAVYSKCIDDLLKEIYNLRKIVICSRILCDNYWPKKPVSSWRHVEQLREALDNWEGEIIK